MAEGQNKTENTIRNWMISTSSTDLKIIIDDNYQHKMWPKRRRKKVKFNKLKCLDCNVV